MEVKRLFVKLQSKLLIINVTGDTEGFESDY